jgi:hypothetical protein
MRAEIHSLVAERKINQGKRWEQKRVRNIDNVSLDDICRRFARERQLVAAELEKLEEAKRKLAFCSTIHLRRKEESCSPAAGARSPASAARSPASAALSPAPAALSPASAALSVPSSASLASAALVTPARAKTGKFVSAAASAARETCSSAAETPSPGEIRKRRILETPRQRAMTRSPGTMNAEHARLQAELEVQRNAIDASIAAVHREHRGMPLTRPQIREWMNSNEDFFRGLMKDVRLGSRKGLSVRQGARPCLPSPVDRWRPIVEAPRVPDPSGLVGILFGRDGWVGLRALDGSQALVLVYTHRWKTFSWTFQSS